MSDSKKRALIAKYNQPVPRYTSYPSHPFWNDVPSRSSWLDLVKKTFTQSNSESGISLYIHLPFCETLCTYCGCNKRITRNHKVEEGYITTLLNEWNTYLKCFPEKPIIRELHLGGGYPYLF